MALRAPKFPELPDDDTDEEDVDTTTLALVRSLTVELEVDEEPYAEFHIERKP